MELRAGALHPPLPSPSPERPGWGRTTFVTLVAFALGGLAFGAAAGLLSLAGLQAGSIRVVQWPAYSGDAWAWLAATSRTAFACWLLAWALRRCTRDWTDDWDLRLWPVAVAFAIAIGAASGETSVGLAGFALVVVVTRNVALAPRPAPRWQPSRRVRAVVVIAVVSLAVVSLAYRPLHPLSAAFEDRASDASFGISGGHHPGDPPFEQRALGFMLGNDGIAAMTVRSVRALGARPGDVAILTHRSGVRTAHSLAGLYRPTGAEQLARGARFSGSLQLTRAACLDAAPNEVTGISVRYETLGMTRTQQLAIDPPARLSCRGS